MDAMQTHRDASQTQMMLVASLEERIPQDYYLRKLNRVLDLGFVHEMVRPFYCQTNGRPCIDPEVIVRLFVLQAITGTASVRALLREADVHLGYRWFIGYDATEPLPDHSTLSRALSRFGDDVFTEILQRSIRQCQQSGLIEGKILHVDATTVRADLDEDAVNKPGSSDPDARFGRFPNGRKEPGYKEHVVVDDKSRVILAVGVTPANANEGLEALGVLDEAYRHLQRNPEVVCADSAYASGQNAAECHARGIRLVSPPGQGHNHHSKSQFTIGDFTYDELRDMFTCPAGKYLTNSGRLRKGRDRWRYRASARDCRACVLREQCTAAPQRSLNASSHHAALVRLRADSKTAEFTTLYRSRAPKVEGVFAEAKQWHGLRRAWRRGLAKMRIQCVLIAAVLNFKRLAGCLPTGSNAALGLLLLVLGAQRLLCRASVQLPPFTYRRNNLCSAALRT